ncbi:MAG: triose-phosphate isomerase [Chitinophagales bacterium]|nr:triose-phosphate isomerase [Chitinophagales bacterium]MDW8427607.1 triose-phosphate isomerase [Chitinophagales bacterium]
MRKKIVAGNWKMHKTCAEARQLVTEVLKGLMPAAQRKARVVFCPPFTALETVCSLVAGEPEVFAGAQNCHWANHGAFTGEVAATMIKACGASYVILGHSERRQYFSETNVVLAQKVVRALEAGLAPIFCVGEPLEVREANQHKELVATQIREGLFHLTASQFAQLTIAYEPVWAIGTGKVATEEQAQEMHAFIRSLIAERYGTEIAENTTIMYGGSCKPSNAGGLFAQPDVDGGLIGGASLNAEEFLGIIHAC